MARWSSRFAMACAVMLLVSWQGQAHGQPRTDNPKASVEASLDAINSQYADLVDVQATIGQLEADLALLSQPRPQAPSQQKAAYRQALTQMQGRLGEALDKANRLMIDMQQTQKDLDKAKSALPVPADRAEVERHVERLARTREELAGQVAQLQREAQNHGVRGQPHSPARLRGDVALPTR
jgi:chromosome segregation ATPase